MSAWGLHQQQQQQQLHGRVDGAVELQPTPEPLYPQYSDEVPAAQQFGAVYGFAYEPQPPLSPQGDDQAAFFPLDEPVVANKYDVLGTAPPLELMDLTEAPYGNRMDPLLIRTEPFSLEPESYAVVTPPSGDGSPVSFSASMATPRTSEDDDHGDDDDDAVADKKALLLQQRRKRNREAMQRARRKEKELLTSLRTTLRELDAQYKALTKWEVQATSPQQAAECQRLQKQLAAVIQRRRELEAENAVVIHALDDQKRRLRDLERVLAECRLEDAQNDFAAAAEKLALLEAQEAQYSSQGTKADWTTSNYEYGFVPLSNEEVNALLSTFCNNLQTAKEHALVAPSHEPFFDVLGWQSHRHIDADNQMHFEFIKCFHHLSTREMAERAWSDGVDLEQYSGKRKSPNPNIRCMEFLQQVNERVRIIVREMKHPVENTIFRTHYALFMLETREGYLLGIQSINPSTEQQEQLKQQRQEQDQQQPSEATESVVWADVCIYIEFVRRPHAFAGTNVSDDGIEGFRQDDCEVHWRGRTNYKTPKHAAENALSFLMGILKWENQIAGPRFHLTAS
uniref:BZIP domain-containing protein n=1 Tax=Globisporangium ultimum (strain ATCC 200006 / CBS 805.95 / DAOM BR144) TaxID=431595 RepID=K3WXC5_GLOUD